jgi:7-carboxy-7-deazaguanine synthase
MKSDSTLEQILNVVEIFHSIQGEGANTGRSAVFVRLAHCNENCWFCDTDWSKYTEMTVLQVLVEVRKLSKPDSYPNNLLIWTGGEPTMQLTDKILEHFSEFYNCIETNGTNPVPSRIQYVSCSPKVSPEILRKNFNRVNEFRYPVGAGDILPEITELPTADHYFISPLFTGNEKKRMEQNNENILYSIDYIKRNPQWRLSLQIHKLLNIP